MFCHLDLVICHSFVICALLFVINDFYDAFFR